MNAIEIILARMRQNDGCAGLQYEPEDHHSLADAMREIVLDEEKRRRIKRNAFVLAEMYDVVLQYGRFVRLLESVVNTPQRIH